MDRDEIRDQFRDLSVWKRGSERAPHKPLLVLWTLGRYAAGADRLLQYEEIDRALQKLLRDFGPPRTSYHPEYPFWYLQNNGVWEVKPGGRLRVREGKASQPPRSELLRAGAAGGLTPDLFQAVVRAPGLLAEIARELLAAHFPETLHEDILQEIGLDLDDSGATRRLRDPGFRSAVLLAYNARCAVCDFDLRLGDVLVGVEAAHIKWHQARGPDIVPNGLALCSLHHKLFDRGAFTLTPAHVLEVSQHATGGGQTESILRHHHGNRIRVPPDPAAHPRVDFLQWHRAEVFRSPGVYLAT